MAKRVTEAQLQKLVDRINKLQNRPAVGWKRSEGRKDVRTTAQVGHLYLNHAACYGGWDLEEIQTESGGAESLIGNTFGGRGRVNAHEMETFLLGMLAVLEPRTRPGDTTPHR